MSAINKIVLDTDGLVVGTNQLITTGGGVTVGKNLVVQGNIYPTAINANGDIGTAGAILASNGTGVYWATSAGFTNGQSIQVSTLVVTSANASFQGNVATSNQVTGTIVVTGGVGISDSVYVGNKVGYANSANVSVAYTFYNANTNSLDTVFG